MVRTLHPRTALDRLPLDAVIRRTDAEEAADRDAVDRGCPSRFGADLSAGYGDENDARDDGDTERPQMDPTAHAWFDRKLVDPECRHVQPLSFRTVANRVTYGTVGYASVA
eukprot:gene26356-biopygen22703